MTLKTILEFDGDSDDCEIYDQIADILNRRMPNTLRGRAWLTFIVGQLSSNSVVDKEGNAEDVSADALTGRWDEAHEILCKHVDNAVAEIKDTFGA